MRGLRGCALAQPAEFARAAAALERNDEVVGERAAFVEVARHFRGFIFDFIVERADGELTDAALLVGRQPVGDPLFQRGVRLVGLAQIGEDAAAANFDEIRGGAGLRDFIAQLRMQQRQRDQAEFGLVAGVAGARR